MTQREMAIEVAYRILESTKASLESPRLPPTPEEAMLLAREFLRVVEGYEYKLDRPVS
jgi:hypothetical protein